MLGFKRYICVCFLLHLKFFLFFFLGVFFISCFSIMVREGTCRNGRRDEAKGGGMESTKNEDAKKTRKIENNE